MWEVAGILAAGGLITYIEAPYLIRKKMIRELCMFTVVLIAGVTVSILQSLRIPLPNPLDWITVLNKPISDVLYSILQ
ncbi:MAG: hypothetical protein K0S39_2354 [Paenibacillus sp.]|jgi:hypothetical protein|nr:hypothetical protein [Paenibacillus sp.]